MPDTIEIIRGRATRIGQLDAGAAEIIARAEDAADIAEALADAMVGTFDFPFTADGVLDYVDLPFAPNDIDSIISVTIGGAPQREENYSLSGARVTFDEVPDQNLDCEIRVALRVSASFTPTAYKVYGTVSQLVADAAALAVAVGLDGAVQIEVKGSLAIGDRGAATLMVTAATGSETTVTQNGLTVAPGFEIMLGHGIKATWPDRRANAVTMGMRNMLYSTQDQSVAANDAFLNSLGAMFASQFALWIPSGTHWHLNGNATLTGFSGAVVEGDGVGRTVIKQADHLLAGVPFYGTPGSPGTPNPDIESAALIEMYGGGYGAIRGIEYNARFMRIRGLWIRGDHHVIEDCRVTETCGRAFAASNTEIAEPDTLDPAFGWMEIRNCVAVRSVGTAISQYGNQYGKIFGCRVEKCWAEGVTQDASHGNLVTGNILIDVNRFDDQAGYPCAGVWNGVNGNGGIAAIGSASVNNVTITGNLLLGSGQDDPNSNSRTRPFIRLRPNKINMFGAVIADNLCDLGFIGVHIEAYNNVTDASYLGLHVCKDFAITGNVFRDLRCPAGVWNTAQGTIQVDEGCRFGTISGNMDENGIKVFSIYNVATAPLVDDTPGHLDVTVRVVGDPRITTFVNLPTGADAAIIPEGRQYYVSNEGDGKCIVFRDRAGGKWLRVSDGTEALATPHGRVIPSLTTTQRDAISSPPNGTVLYNSTTATFQERQAGAWVTIAYLESPTFTGAPAAPTPAFGDNSTLIATTAFMQNIVAFGFLGADYTLTSTTATQKLFNFSTNGALTMATGRYQFKMLLYLTTMDAGAASNLQIRLAGTATLAKVIEYIIGRDGASGTATGAVSGSLSVTANSNSEPVSGVAAAELSLLIEGTFDVTVTGTLIPSLQLSVAAAAVVKANSGIIVGYLGPTGAATKGTWT